MGEMWAEVSRSQQRLFSPTKEFSLRVANMVGGWDEVSTNIHCWKSVKRFYVIINNVRSFGKVRFLFAFQVSPRCRLDDDYTYGF